jgi:opacity protein-like surface antigen
MSRFLLIASMLALCAAPAAAAEKASSYGSMAIGPRVGFSSGPDQFVFGGQWLASEVAQNVTFDPAVEIGAGDNRTLLGLDIDFHYHFETTSRWRPYLGAGATLQVVNYDQDHFGNKDSETQAGGGIIIGADTPTRSGNRFFGELKLGLGDAPDLKIMVGWYFRM